MMFKKPETEKKDKKIENKSLFSKDNVNMKHQSEFDYLKTLGVFLIAHVHVYDDFSYGYFRGIIDYLGFLIGAGGFMILMGLGMKYSRHHEIKNYIDRGISLLTMGQLLNLFRDCLPNLIAYWTTGNKIFISRAMQIFQTDIFTFAGIVFLIFTLIKKIKLSDSSIFIISIIMNFLGFGFYKIMKPPKDIFLSIFLGFFILTDAETFFPLFSYFIFVGFGYWLGGIYQKISDKNKFYNLVLIICFPISFIYYFLRSHFIFPIFPEYYTIEHYCLLLGPDAFACCMSNLIFLAIFYKIDVFLKGKTPEFVTHCAKNFTQYYIISYLLIEPTYTFLSATKGDEYPSKMKYPTLFASIVLVLCRMIIDINHKYIHFTIINLKIQKRNIVFALIWIASIISAIYIYQRIEVMATIWNNYLRKGDE